MVRPLGIRRSYTGDRSRLSRLELAIEKDTRIPVEKRALAGKAIREAINMLMEIDSALGQQPMKKSA